jgi:hypothetical protein
MSDFWDNFVSPLDYGKSNSSDSEPTAAEPASTPSYSTAADYMFETPGKSAESTPQNSRSSGSWLTDLGQSVADIFTGK